jgi:hypothetical protein
MRVSRCGVFLSLPANVHPWAGRPFSQPHWAYDQGQHAGSRGSLIVWLTPDLPFAPALLAEMDPRDQYRDNLSSSGSDVNGQWSPPPRFQEHDQIYSAQVSPQTYPAHPHSPPQVSPPLQEYREGYIYPNHDEVPHAIYEEG